LSAKGNNATSKFQTHEPGTRAGVRQQQQPSFRST